MSPVNFIQSTDDLKTNGGVCFEEVIQEDMRRSRRADAYENGRDRPPCIKGRGRIAEMVTEEADDLVAELGQCLPCVAGEFLIRQILQQSWNQGEFSERPDGADSFAHDEIVGITQERGKQGVEGIRESAEEARNFHAVSLAFLATLARHFIKNLARCFKALRFTGTREIGGHGGAHGKISAVSKFCQKREGINVGVVNEVEHGFGSNAVVGVFQQGFDGRENGLVAGGGENRDGFLANFGRGMVQETANHGMSSALTLDFEEAERVENFFWVGGKDFAG